MSEQDNTALDTQAPAAAELQPGVGAPVDGAVDDNTAQPTNDDVAAQEAAAAEEARAQANRDRANRRFGDLTKERNAAAQEAAYWKGIAEERARSGAPPRPLEQLAAAPADANAPPNPADFAAGEFDPAFTRALARFEAKQILAEERTAQQQAQAQAEAQRAMQAGETRWRTAIETATSEGFEEGALVLDRLGRTPGMRDVVDSITETADPAYAAEYFARNPEELQAVIQMPPRQRDRYLGAVEVQAAQWRKAQTARSAQPAPTPARTQNAPVQQPAMQATPTVNGRGATSVFNPETASLADFERRLAEHRAARG